MKLDQVNTVFDDTFDPRADEKKKEEQEKKEYGNSIFSKIIFYVPKIYLGIKLQYGTFFDYE